MAVLDELPPVWGGVVDIAPTKMLNFIREGPNFAGLASILDARFFAVEGVAAQILNAFDLDTALFDRLDVIGAWLGRPREGLSDVRYRRALRVQRTSILSSTGTAPALLQIFLDWTGTDALEYQTAPPATVQIGGIVAVQDENLLVQFLQTAKPGGVVLFVYGRADNNTLLNDFTDTPITDPGTTDYTDDPISGAALTSYELFA